MPTGPTRTCVGCGRREPKESLLRVARAPGGDRVSVDPRGTAPGRGAYIHLRAECVAAAMVVGRIGRRLRARLGPDELVRLHGEIEKVMNAT
jgi:predicted RNA-binding protein YlxR (DUF448 family)